MNNTTQQKQLNEVVINVLKRAITDSDKMWVEGASHATIIGYLQGTIKAVTRELESRQEKN